MRTTSKREGRSNILRRGDFRVAVLGLEGDASAAVAVGAGLCRCRADRQAGVRGSGGLSASDGTLGRSVCRRRVCVREIAPTARGRSGVHHPFFQRILVLCVRPVHGG